MKKALFILSFILCSLAANAQSLSSLFNKVVSGVTEAVDIMPIEGTWVYTSPEIKFKSDNVLASLGGEVASSKVEQVLGNVYPKLGFNENWKYTFNADSTFIHYFKIGKSVTKLEGTYSIDKSNKNIVFVYKIFGKINIGRVNAYYANSGSTLSIVYDAEVLMNLIKKLASAATSVVSSSSVATIEGLLDKYKGLQLGYKLAK